VTFRPFRDELHRDAALLKWLRREVNRDLRYWRTELGILPADRCTGLIDDCKAKLALLSWAERWQDVRTEKYARDHYYASRPDVAATMEGNVRLIVHAVRRVAAGYRARDGWRPEWDVQE